MGLIQTQGHGLIIKAKDIKFGKQRLLMLREKSGQLLTILYCCLPQTIYKNFRNTKRGKNQAKTEDF